MIVTMAPAKLVMVPPIFTLIRSPAARVKEATVAIKVPFVVVLATVVVERSMVPVKRTVPDPAAVVPVNFSICKVPDVEPVVCM